MDKELKLKTKEISILEAKLARQHKTIKKLSRLLLAEKNPRYPDETKEGE